MKKSQARLQLVIANGRKVRSVNRLSVRALRRRVHRKQVVSADVLPFAPRCSDDRSPSGLGNALSLLPLLDSPMTLTNGVSQLRDGIPALKKVVDGFHVTDCASDNSSGQGRTNDPVKKNTNRRTICPMGRGRTPSTVIEEICSRIRAARVMAGYSDQAKFAKLMGIKEDTYARYEQRTPMPHRYFPRFVELTGADLNVVLTGRRHGDIKKTG